jgi:hypothetical protein
VANQTQTLNPYARYLRQEDPLSVISSTLQRLEQLISSKSDEKLQAKPSPKKWSVRDILCHLADTEIVFAYRFRQTVAEPHHIIQPYDQDAFAAAYRIAVRAKRSTPYRRSATGMFSSFAPSFPTH